MIGKSMRGRVWNILNPDPAHVQSLINMSIEPVLAHIIAARGISTTDTPSFLNPTLRSLLPNPDLLPDMPLAVERVIQALKKNQTIWVWGDYDVDGACSTAIITKTLRDLGATVHFRIPDRITEGYGPNEEGIRTIAASGADLLIVVDAGTVAFAPMKLANDIGLDVIILDHHLSQDVLPKAVAVVNPNRRDAANNFGYLCAAGVCFLFCVALVAKLRILGTKELPDLFKILDIVALATVADIVPLTGVNRAFVCRGLNVMAKTENYGLRALKIVSGIKETISAGNCGFLLGPRINAGGRVGDSEAGTRLLLAQDSDEAMKIAKSLDECNKTRQSIEKTCLKEAILQTTESGVQLVWNRDWHEGVVGIVAARIKERLDLPAFVFGGSEHGLLKGSGRSVAGFNLGAVVQEAVGLGLLKKGGGHPMAAGATLPQENITDFQNFLNTCYNNSPAAQIGIPVDIDLVIPINLLSESLLDLTQGLEPFGMGNPTPRVMIPKARLDEVAFMGENGAHMKIIASNGTYKIKAVAFNMNDTPFARALLNHQGHIIDLYGTLVLNEFNNRRTIELRLEDARIAQ